MRVIKICKTCKKEFTCYDVGKRIYTTCCSRSCSAEQKKGERVIRELRTCPICSAEFRILRSLSKTYCSINCQHRSLRKVDHISDNDKLSILKNKYDKFVVKRDGCWDWNGSTQKGYGAFLFMRRGIRAHRVSWVLFNGVIPEGMHVLHSCDNKICSNPEHLFLGSHADNMKDMRSKGLHKQYSKLTRDQAKEIKMLLSQGEKIENISQKYKISVPTVYDIKDGRTWRSLQ